jgi:predicted secreted protein
MRQFNNPVLQILAELAESLHFEMALAGKNVVVKVSPTAGGAGVYTAVAGIKSVSGELAGTNLDITVFTAAFLARLQGLKDTKFSLAGVYESGDTNGQIAIQNAFLNDSVLWIQMLYNGVNGFKQEVKVAKFAVDAAVDKTVDLSVDLEGNGALTVI